MPLQDTAYSPTPSTSPHKSGWLGPPPPDGSGLKAFRVLFIPATKLGSDGKRVPWRPSLLSKMSAAELRWVAETIHRELVRRQDEKR